MEERDVSVDPQASSKRRTVVSLRWTCVKRPRVAGNVGNAKAGEEADDERESAV